MMRGGRYRALSIASTSVGVVLFAALVYETGAATILESVRAFGSAFVLLLAIAGLRHLLRTLAWRSCIEPGRRTVPFVDLFGIRLAAEAVTDLTFAGPVLGESVKAVTVSQRMDATDSLSSIVIENLVYSLSVALFVASGVAVFVAGAAAPERMRLAAAVVGVGLLVPIVVLQIAISRRVLVLTSTIAYFANRGVRVPSIARWREAIRRFEEQVVAFYAERRGLFVVVLTLEVLACATGIVEAYVILRVLAGHTTLADAFLVETVNRVVNAVFPFIPLRVGADEGGAALVFHVLGYTTSAGVSLAVIRKIRNIAWIAIGLACMARYAVSGGATPAIAEVGDGEETAHRQRR